MPRTTKLRQARSFREAIRLENLQVAALAEVAAGNTTAKGDQGEDVIIQALSKRLGSNFRAAKGEIIDSDGRASPELDCIIYDASVCAVVSDTWSGRKLIRCEAVVMTIQIRSVLTKAYLTEMWQGHADWGNNMTRYYRPSGALQLLHAQGGKTAAEIDRIVNGGVVPKVDAKGLPRVPTCVLGYRTRCSMETAAGELGDFSTDYVCVLNKFLVGATNPGFMEGSSNFVVWERGQDSFLAFLGVLEFALEQYANSRQWFIPDWRRYYRRLESSDQAAINKESSDLGRATRDRAAKRRGSSKGR